MNKLLQGRVAIVTGAGTGLGRAHALALAQHGAHVVVNDVAGTHAASPAGRLVDEITRQGGSAIADGGDVTSFAAMQALATRALDSWGRVDILVNNAGILRDRSFSKMSLDDFRQVMEVHVMGAVHATKAVWDTMRAQRHGRIVMTTSSSGLYGNFGQSNYSAAKLALVGLVQTLALEGERHGIRVNALAPTAATAMTESILAPEALARLHPGAVSPGLVALVADDAPTRTVLLAGAGSFEAAHITMTRGVFIGDGPDAAHQVLAQLDAIRHRHGEMVPQTGFEQYRHELSKAGVEVALPG